MWADIKKLHKAAEGRHILDLFAEDDMRADAFSVSAGDMLLDYSKTSIGYEERDALISLCRQYDVEGRRNAMFAGERINQTEDRAVLHTALRNADRRIVAVDGKDVMPEICDTLGKMRDFAAAVRNGPKVGAGGRFSDVVNIGIGGSDLGPAMATLALAPYHDGPRLHYVSNVDGAHISDTLARLDPKTTLVIVASKTFTTVETLTNARYARDWMRAGGGDVSAQFAALSSAVDQTAEFGIVPDHVFGFEDWVGGRYSIWGPIGLPLMIAIGDRRFSEFLRGGLDMDNHFLTAPLDQNMPVMLALVGLWHHQVCGCGTRAVLPYDQRLARLPAYLQQLEMESNGKSVAMDGSALQTVSGPIVWGEPGTNGQHAFYQLIHQGTAVVPCEFMVAATGHEAELKHHHALLVANCLAQSEALMRGRTKAAARGQLAGRDDLTDAQKDLLACHKTFAGNRPSTTLIYPKLTPFVLGQIIALYEHRVFVEGVILGINSFDQWGVELGKKMALSLAPVLAGAEDGHGRDASTLALVGRIRAMQRSDGG